MVGGSITVHTSLGYIEMNAKIAFAAALAALALAGCAKKEEAVEATQGLGRPPRQGGAAGIVQHVLHQDRQLRPLEAKLPRLKFVLHHGRHARAVASQGAGGGQTDARTCAGDEGAASLKLGDATGHAHSPR